MNSPSPSGPNVASDRDAGGRFRKGNPGEPGNPMARRVGKLRAALIRSVTPDEVRKIIAGLVKAAVDGDVSAAKLLFDRLLGPPQRREMRMDVPWAVVRPELDQASPVVRHRQSGRIRSRARSADLDQAQTLPGHADPMVDFFADVAVAGHPMVADAFVRNPVDQSGCRAVTRLQA